MQKCIQLHEATQIALSWAEKLDIKGELEILLGGVFLLAVGGKLDEELFWQFDSFVMLKMVVKIIFGYCGGPQSSCRKNHGMYTERS